MTTVCEADGVTGNVGPITGEPDTAVDMDVDADGEANADVGTGGVREGTGVLSVGGEGVFVGEMEASGNIAEADGEDAGGALLVAGGD